jgi:hypothetical protein
MTRLWTYGSGGGSVFNYLVLEISCKLKGLREAIFVSCFFFYYSNYHSFLL